ncbi:MAG: phosphoribosylformylglycinamidine synthase [Calditrichae bacterium]|nr:phosphoribosylformylglycinamidine synthase [Calditrichia bacterium]
MTNIFRVYIEKKAGFDTEAVNLYSDVSEFLGIKSLEKLRILYRYDVQGISEDEYKIARNSVFSDPPQDYVYDENFNFKNSDYIFAVEYLPGQYDQRSDSASQCIQILTQKNPPLVRTAKVFVLSGILTESEIKRIKKHCINPVDSREAELQIPETLEQQISIPEHVKIIDGFIELSDQSLENLLSEMGLAMSFEDLKFCQQYFKTETKRNPTITEIRLLDTYWSDHCRHTTFLTEIRNVQIADAPNNSAIKQTYNAYLKSREFVYEGKERSDCLMDLATIAMKELRKKGGLKELDISEEINACSIKIPVKVEGITQDWLIMFKNETHNHPTEIEPFGGAATCLGGAIRDPLSGRSYVYQAMRVTGSADPRKSLEETLPGKLPQRTITTLAAKGYSSYGNQIGLATGHVAEVYDEGYLAKRMEIGAVIGAVPAENVVRKRPEEGDIVILVGGKTGRDGIGGATGSSKAHTETALKNEAEVQKGNPPIERKLQRLFTDPEITKKIKRCNDFGAGGISVAIGELADSLDIDLDAVPKKYEGLDGTELAISESQERMAVVISVDDFVVFQEKAFAENLEATKVANITNSGRLRMFWKGQTVVDLDRSFLDTHGVRQKSHVVIPEVSATEIFEKKNYQFDDFAKTLLENLSDLNHASQKGLIEQFDSTIGARTVLHPFGGKMLRSPSDVMVSKLPFIESDTATAMSWGFNPKIATWSPFHGAVYAVLESVTKLVACGVDFSNIYLTLQEYFEKLLSDPQKWGKPYAALLGAYHVQMQLGIAAIGGKDSMSGTFQDIHVPPTLVSFAVAPVSADKTISGEFKTAGNTVYLLKSKTDMTLLPDFDYLKTLFATFKKLSDGGLVQSASAVKSGGVSLAVSRMCFGNNLGFNFNNQIESADLLYPYYGAIIIETAPDFSKDELSGIEFIELGRVTEADQIVFKNSQVNLSEAYKKWSEPLEAIFPSLHNSELKDLPSFKTRAIKKAHLSIARPRVFIPVFPGTNCEYDSQQAFEKAGADVVTSIFNNLTTHALNMSIKKYAQLIRSSQILMLPGGFSAGDEPEGSGKFIAAVLRQSEIADAIMDLLENRDGLVLGICNGFQALVKLGLVPFGKIVEPHPEKSPTLTFNKLRRHHSQMVHTKINSVLSPWFSQVNSDDTFVIPVSNGEGRFVAAEPVIQEMFVNGQVATLYVDLDGKPSMESQFNPSGSMYAIEGITSPDGRVFGKMAHSERIGMNVSKNVPGNKNQRLFESGVAYFK